MTPTSEAYQINADEKDNLDRWQRSLIIISLPHSAAFGAFLGRYEIKQGPDAFLSIMLLAAVVPIVTLWLFLVHDLLRNAFLRMGHYGKCNKFKHNAIFSAVIFIPCIPVVLIQYIKNYMDLSSISLISITMLSWVFFAIIVSNDLYVKIVRPLGVKLDD